jgi:hypothetical protein
MMKELRPEVEDEWYTVRHAGEIPEIALHSALHYLSEAEDGPRLVLAAAEIRHLQQAAARRFREIVLRDMLRENLDKPIFRGLSRSMINFGRYETFLVRSGFTDRRFHRRFRHEAAITLAIFLVREWTARRRGLGAHDLGVTAGELGLFAERLAMPSASFAAFFAEILAAGTDEKKSPAVLP